MSSVPLHNPYLAMEGYNCFGCSPHNPYGLHLCFLYDDETDEVFAMASPALEHCGYPGVLHGGIQATLLDEVGYWAVHQKLCLPAFTTRLELEIVRAVRIPAAVQVRARVVETHRKLVIVEARLLVGEAEHARAKITYYRADDRIWERVTGRPATTSCDHR